MVRASSGPAVEGQQKKEKAQAILAVGSFDSPGTGMDGGDETIVICPQIEGHFFLCFGGAEFFPRRNVFLPSFSAITQEQWNLK